MVMVALLYWSLGLLELPEVAGLAELVGLAKLVGLLALVE
jgi:hypothetical protein